MSDSDKKYLKKPIGLVAKEKVVKRNKNAIDFKVYRLVWIMYYVLVGLTTVAILGIEYFIFYRSPEMMYFSCDTCCTFGFFGVVSWLFIVGSMLFSVYSYFIKKYNLLEIDEVYMHR